jgi:hypothetical protein
LIYHTERSTTILNLTLVNTESELTPVRNNQEKLWSALILTGGTSNRFGSDKSEARLDGMALIDFLISSIPKLAGIYPCIWNLAASFLLCRTVAKEV